MNFNTCAPNETYAIVGRVVSNRRRSTIEAKQRWSEEAGGEESAVDMNNIQSTTTNVHDDHWRGASPLSPSAVVWCVGSYDK